MNDDRGRGLRDWVLFAIGCAIIVVGVLILVALAVVWVVTGRSADPGLVGFAAVVLGYGNILLSQFLRNGNGGGK